MNKFFVEFVGALFFVFVGIVTGNPIATGAALAFVLLIEAAVLKTSGGGLNPAVTIALAAADKISAHDIIPYCAAQIVGALVAVQLAAHVSV